MNKESPGLALLIGHALAKKGKAKNDPMPSASDESGVLGEDDINDMEHLSEIASDMLKVIDQGDAKGLADLLREAFEFLDAQPHDEGEDTSK